MYKQLSLIKAKKSDYDEICHIGKCETAYVFLDKKEDIVGYFWYDFMLDDDRVMYIDFIMAKKENVGWGKSMIHYLFSNFDITGIKGETNIENKGYWAKVGSVIPENFSDEDREMYDFSLKKEDFYKASNEV